MDETMSDDYQTAHLSFTHTGDSASGKTKRWEVVSNNGLLAEIMWYGQWRKYCFFPFMQTVFDVSCLREIADFCEARTREHKS